jgi:hypothetical protein
MTLCKSASRWALVLLTVAGCSTIRKPGAPLTQVVEPSWSLYAPPRGTLVCFGLAAPPTDPADVAFRFNAADAGYTRTYTAAFDSTGTPRLLLFLSSSDPDSRGRSITRAVVANFRAIDESGYSEIHADSTGTVLPSGANQKRLLSAAEVDSAQLLARHFWQHRCGRSSP